MKSSAVGLYPLPVELWQEIFTIAANSDERMQEITYSVLTPCYFFTEEDVFQTPLTAQHRFLLRTRHSIILVCKSWYFIGIPILWSHLQFNEGDPRNIAAMIYIAIERNPILASYVVRLTIKSVLFRQENLVQPEKIYAVAKFVPLLTNLEAISCSLPYAAHINPVTRPRLVIINNHDEDKSNFRNDIVRSTNLLLQNSFWTHCDTLSLSLIKCGHFNWNAQNYDTPQLIFENLTSLRLDVSHVVMMRWIEEKWQFPILKYLSFINTPYVNRIEFLGRVRMTLEELEVSYCQSSRNGFDDTHKLELPKLREISLVNAPRWHEESQQYWFDAIEAPELEKFIISLRPDPLGHRSPSSVVNDYQNAVECFPSVLRVIFITPPEDQSLAQPVISLKNPDPRLSWVVGRGLWSMGREMGR
jgi:hypothetical protein